MALLCISRARVRQHPLSSARAPCSLPLPPGSAACSQCSTSAVSLSLSLLAPVTCSRHCMLGTSHLVLCLFYPISGAFLFQSIIDTVGSWTVLRCRSSRCKGKRQPHRPQHALQRGERRIPLPRKRAIERLPVQLGGFGHGPEAAVRVGHAAERQQELLLRPLKRRREVRGGQFRIAQLYLQEVLVALDRRPGRASCI
jgi:hypothetical protein